MTRPFLAGAALLLGAALALPLAASAADNPPQPGQEAPAAAPSQPETGMMHGMMGREMMEHEGRHHRMMMRRMARSPQQHCIDRMARRAGMIAYTMAKLNLTPEQRQTWSRVQAALDAAGQRRRQLCEALPASRQAAEQQTLLDRLARRERFLSARLRDLQQIQPPLQQFYQSLAPAQQAIVNHPFRG